MYLWINRGNINNSINLKVNNSNKNNNSNLDQNNINNSIKLKVNNINKLNNDNLYMNNIYLMGLIQKVLKVYNSKYKLESDTDNFLDIYFLFKNKFEELKKSLFVDSIAISEKELYNNKNKIDLLKKLHNNNKSSEIKNHNSKLKMPSLTEMLKEKAFVLKMENDNIIKKSNHKYTPLINTQYGIDSGYPIRDLIHNWLLTSRLFTHEFNILVSAYKYCLYKINNNNINKHAYNLWQIRQMSTYFEGCLHLIDVEAEAYIKDLLSFEYMYREITEDLLYISLHLLLASSIINHMNKLDLENINEKDFFKEISLVVEKHNKDYAEGYDILNNLRTHGVNNHYSCVQLKGIYDRFS